MLLLELDYCLNLNCVSHLIRLPVEGGEAPPPKGGMAAPPTGEESDCTSHNEEEEGHMI